jgi:hypothetical protein
MKTLTILALSILPFICHSQMLDKVDISGKPEIIYIKAALLNKISIKKSNYATMDYGEGWKSVTDSNGEKMPFENEMAFFNYLAGLGWRYVTTLSSQVDGQYLFVRKEK